MRFTETMTPEEETGVAQLAIEVQEQVDVRGTWVMDDDGRWRRAALYPRVTDSARRFCPTRWGLADPRRTSQTLAEPRRTSQTLAYPRL